MSANEFDEDDRVEVISETDEYYILNEYRVGKKYKLNKDGSVIDSKIQVFEDRGFKFGNYVELLINYAMLYGNDFEMQDFSIGNVSVKIDNPSILYDAVMNEFCGDKYYESDSYYTISLQGITNDNYEEYLAKAIYLIGYYNPSTEDGSYPECFEFLGELYYKYATDEEIVDNRRKNDTGFNTKCFPDLQHYEAISFYNEGMSLQGREIAFQYFYKVLEHFFLICRQDEFKNLIANYNANNDINVFTDEVVKIYKTQEDIQLKILLTSIQSDITNLVHDAYVNSYISAEDVEEFGEKLYLYRNTIVHGKSDERFFLKTPSQIGDKKELFWTTIVEKIAEALIRKYCIVK